MPSHEPGRKRKPFRARKRAAVKPRETPAIYEPIGLGATYAYGLGESEEAELQIPKTIGKLKELACLVWSSDYALLFELEQGSGARGREPPHDGRNTPQADGGAVDLRQARPAKGGPRGAAERKGDGHGGGGDEASESAEALLLGLRALAGSAFAPRLRGAVEPPARQPGAAQSRDYSRVPSNGHGGE